VVVTSAQLLSVNVGGVRTIDVGDRAITTAIWKSPAEGRVAVAGVNLSGDDQADREVHGGEHKAVYAYAWEDTLWWQEELGRELEPGNFGENLTLGGVEVAGAVVGERWRVGSALLEVSEPRFPCFKLGLRMGDPTFLKRFAESSRPGAYLRILAEGELGAGDAIEVDLAALPDHGVSMRLLSDALLLDDALIPQALAAPQLIPSLRDWLASRAA